MQDAKNLTWTRTGEDCRCQDGRVLRVNPAMTDAYVLAIINGWGPEQARRDAVDGAIANDDVIASLKAMTNAQFDAWWSANVTNTAQAVAVLKRITRLVIRRAM